jgi:hypothetical protein
MSGRPFFVPPEANSMSDFYPALPDADVPLSPAARLRRRVAMGLGGAVVLFFIVSVLGMDPTGVGALVRSLVRAAVAPQQHTDGSSDTAGNLLIGIGPLLSAAVMTFVVSALRFRWAVVAAGIVGVLIAFFVVETLFVQSGNPELYKSYRTWYLFALFSSIAAVAGTALGCTVSYARERM